MTHRETTTKTFRTYANGEYNADMEIEATLDGIELDLGITLSWEWILAAYTELNEHKFTELQRG